MVGPSADVHISVAPTGYRGETLAVASETRAVAPDRTRHLRTAADRLHAFALLVAYSGLVVGLPVAATLSVVYLVAHVPVGLGGLLVLAGSWLGVVVSSPAIARRAVLVAASGIEGDSGAGTTRLSGETSTHAAAAIDVNAVDLAIDTEPGADRLVIDAVSPGAGEGRMAVTVAVSLRPGAIVGTVTTDATDAPADLPTTTAE